MVVYFWFWWKDICKIYSSSNIMCILWWWNFPAYSQRICNVWKYISGQTECSVYPCALFAFCVQEQDLHIIVLPFFINDQLRTKWLKNIVKGLNMNVLKNTDDDRGFIKLRFQCPIYIYVQLRFYFTIVSVRNKNQKWVWFSL